MSKLKKNSFAILCIFLYFHWKNDAKMKMHVQSFLWFMRKPKDDFKFASKVRRGEKWFLCADSDQTDRSRSNLTWRKTSLIDHSRQKGSIREEWKSKKVRSKDCWHFHRFFFFFTMNYSVDICFKKTSQCLKMIKNVSCYFFT